MLGHFGVFDDPQECHSVSHMAIDWRHLQKVNGEINWYSQQNGMKNLFKKISNQHSKQVLQPQKEAKASTHRTHRGTESIES